MCSIGIVWYSTVCIVRCLFMIWKSKLPFTICTKCFFTCFNLIFRLDIHLYSKKYTVCRTNNTFTVTTPHVQCTVQCMSRAVVVIHHGCTVIILLYLFLTPRQPHRSQSTNFLYSNYTWVPTQVSKKNVVWKKMRMIIAIWFNE